MKQKKQKALVKMYDWRALTRLAIEDTRTKLGMTGALGKIHWVGGLDADGHPYIRIDLTPTQGEAKLKS